MPAQDGQAWRNLRLLLLRHVVDGTQVEQSAHARLGSPTPLAQAKGEVVLALVSVRAGVRYMERALAQRNLSQLPPSITPQPVRKYLRIKDMFEVSDTISGSSPSEIAATRASQMKRRDKIALRANDVVLDARRSMSYRHRRASFFGGLHRLAMFVSLFVATSAGVAALQNHDIWALVLSVVVALTVTVDTVSDSKTKCALHMLLSYRFQELEKKIGDWEKLTDEAYERVVLERQSIEKVEPASLRILVVLYHNVLLRSMGCDAEDTPSVPLHRRILANLASQTEYAQKIGNLYLNAK